MINDELVYVFYENFTTVFNLGQLNYVQMIVRFPVALTCYAAFRITTQYSLKYLMLYCFSIVYQFYCVPYTGFYLLYFSLLFICVYLFFTKQLKKTFWVYFNRQVILKTLSILAVSFGLLAVLLWPYIVMSQTVGLRLYKEVLPNVPNVHSYLLAHEPSLLWHFLYAYAYNSNTVPWLHYVFPGMLLLMTLVGSAGVLIYKAVKKQEIPVLLKSLIVVSSIICLLHFRVGDNVSLYALIFKLPGINSIRVPNRFMHVELFFLLLILGFFVRNFNYKWMLLFIIAMLADNSFEPMLVIRTPKQQLVQRQKQLQQQIMQHEGYAQKTLAVIDTITPAYITHLDAMLLSQELGMKTINGYSSYCPNAFGEYFTNCSEKGLNKWMQDQGLKAQDILILKR